MDGTFDGTHSHQDGWPSIRTTRLSMAQLTPRKHEVWTELGSAPLWQAKLRQNVAHAADNCQHGSLMCYDHHVGTRAVHLEFNCPQSAKSDSLQKLVALRQGYFTSCRSLKSSDHAAHAVHSVRCVPDALAKHVNRDVSAPSAGFCLLSCSRSLLLLISVDDGRDLPWHGPKWLNLELGKTPKPALWAPCPQIDFQKQIRRHAERRLWLCIPSGLLTGPSSCSHQILSIEF